MIVLCAVLPPQGSVPPAAPRPDAPAPLESSDDVDSRARSLLDEVGRAREAGDLARARAVVREVVDLLLDDSGGAGDGARIDL